MTTLDVKVLVVVHIHWEVLGGEAQCKCNSVVVWLHLALLTEGLAEDSFAFVVMGGAARRQSSLPHVLRTEAYMYRWILGRAPMCAIVT